MLQALRHPCGRLLGRVFPAATAATGRDVEMQKSAALSRLVFVHVCFLSITVNGHSRTACPFAFADEDALHSKGMRSPGTTRKGWDTARHT